MLNEIFRLFGTIVVDNESAKKNIDETVDYADDQRSKLQQGLDVFAKGALKFGTAFIGAAVTVGTALMNITESTRGYRQEMGRLETAFETNDLTAGQARDTYRGLVAVLGDSDRASEAAAHIAQLADSNKELADWVTICTGVYAEYGASLPIESLMEAANETARTGELTGTLADAINWAGLNERDFQAELDKCNSSQERADVIGQTLIATYGEAAERYRENNDAVMKANAATDDLAAATARMGEAWEPAATAMAQEAAKMAEGTVPVLETISGWIVTVIDNLDKFWDMKGSEGWNAMTSMANDVADTFAPLGRVGMGYSGGGGASAEQTIFLGEGTRTGIRLRGFASGIDFVPNDDMPARLHYGEAVLTRSEANTWRRGQTGGIDYDRLAEAMAQRPMAFNIDGKAFAVMLAREMNRAIGNRNIQTLMAMGG